MLIAGWLVHTVSRKRRNAAPTATGDPSLGALETFPARVERTSVYVKRRDGKSVHARHVFATLTPCEYTDVFWLPSVFGSAADDTSSDAVAREPASIATATNKAGTQGIFQVYFE